MAMGIREPGNIGVVVAKLTYEIWVEMSSGLPDALDSFGPARFVVRNQWLTVIDSHRQIKHDVIQQKCRAVSRPDCARICCIRHDAQMFDPK